MPTEIPVTTKSRFFCPEQPRQDTMSSTITINCAKLTSAIITYRINHLEFQKVLDGKQRTNRLQEASNW